MKYFHLFLIIVSSHCLNAQCATTTSFAITPPTCSTCCDGSIVATHSCAITYTWLCACGGGNVASNLCGGVTYTLLVGMASTLCCGASVGTSTIYLPKPGSTSITELAELNNIVVSPNPNDGKITFTSSKYFSDIEMKLYDVVGKLVLADNLNGIKKEMELNLKNGVYFITLINKETGQQTIRKIVIQK